MRVWVKCEVTFYLQLSTEGSDSLNQESSKILSFFGLSGNTRTLHIWMFNELRWILWSQTLFNIVINKERNVLKCFFHIVNNIKEKEKSVKLGERTGYFLHFCLFCSPVSVSPLTSATLWSLFSTTGNKILQTATKEQAKLKDLPKSLQVFVLLRRKSNQNLEDTTAGLLLGKLERILTLLIKEIHTFVLAVCNNDMEKASHSMRVYKITESQWCSFQTLVRCISQ